MIAQDNNTNGTVFSRVPDLAALVFSGADAASFMQGQFCNDVSALPENGGWQRSAYCSPKGRMLASFILCRRKPATGDGEYVMLLSADVAEETAKRLRMFVLRAKVGIVHAPAAFVSAAGMDLSRGFFSDRDDVLTVGEGDGRGLLCGLGGDAPGMTPAEAVWSGDDSAWRRAQIADGVPWVRTGTREMFIPQAVNYQAPPLDGVSFKKGCYVGQEVVARLHYRGRVKRGLMLASGSGAPPMPGGALRDSAGVSMGNVVDAVPAETGNEFSALICAQLSSAELFLEDSRPLRLSPPPHPVADED